MYRVAPDTENADALPKPGMSDTSRDQLAPIIEQSGILNDGLDSNWVRDPRCVKALLSALGAHEGKICKIGTKSRLVHEIVGAHLLFNDPVYQTHCQADGVDPIWGLVGFVKHDGIENRRDSALKAGRSFDAAAVWDGIKILCPNEWVFENYVRPGITYMTDKPGLHKDKRIAAQIAKSLDESDACKIDWYLQMLRMYDKLSQVMHDASECKAGHVTIKVLRKQIKKAEDKSFVKKFPCAHENKGAFIKKYNSSVMSLKHKLMLLEAYQKNAYSAHTRRDFVGLGKKLLHPMSIFKKLPRTPELLCWNHEKRRLAHG